MNLSQAKPMPKQLNLNKLGDVGRFQIHWPATLAKTDSSSDFGICPNSQSPTRRSTISLESLSPQTEETPKCLTNS